MINHFEDIRFQIVYLDCIVQNAILIA